MKKTLLAATLFTTVAHAANTPEAAIEQLIQHILDGNGEKTVALTHIPPELLAEGVDEAAFKAQLAQCYANTFHQMARDSGQTFANVRTESAADGNHARLFVTMHEKNGGTSEMPPMDAVKNGKSWQIDFVDSILNVCPDLDVGDPRTVLQRYLDVWQRGDADAVFALTHIGEPRFSDLTPTEYIAQAREKFAAFYQTNADLKLRLGDAAAEIDGTEATVAVINDAAGITSTIGLQKTAHGWRVRYW